MSQSETFLEIDKLQGAPRRGQEYVPLGRTPAHPEQTLGIDLSGPRLRRHPSLFLNREFTWINFNWRVLNEARDSRVPLLERLKFIAITGSNLDEFFMKRIGGLKQQLGAGMQQLTVDGRTPAEQISESNQLVRVFESHRNYVFAKAISELAQNGVELANYSELSKSEREVARNYYIDNVFPLVTPQAIDPAHPFPFVSNLSLNLGVSLLFKGTEKRSFARVKVPVGQGIPRFVRVSDGHKYIPLEQVMANNLDLLFPGMTIEECSLFRVTRNAITEQDEEQADDLLAMIETELRERKLAPIVRLQVASGTRRETLDRLVAQLDLTDRNLDVFEVSSMIGVRDLMQLASLEIPELRDKLQRPATSPHIDPDKSIFTCLREHGSILVHHPYESFANSVERLIREAATDPETRAIKMTLYRTDSDSAIINSLLEAARNGKQVAVVLELKARFDEAANIRWATQLERAGIHVTYGIVGLKTHSKVTLIVRQEPEGLSMYSHIGTGNYHAGTARLYSDFGLMTADEVVGRDLLELFNFLTTGYRPKRSYERVLPAPGLLKATLLEKIEREITFVAKGKPGLVQMKMNALEDPDITMALYEASRAGVKVDLLVRDTCRLRPGIPGLSDKINVLSIVGRFLEHARIYYFQNGGEEEYLIGSADGMIRNLESRVEVLIPIEAEELRNELRFFLDVQLEDGRNAWEMSADGSYVQRKAKGRRARGCQVLCIEHAERREREHRAKEAKRVLGR